MKPPPSLLVFTKAVEQRRELYHTHVLEYVVPVLIRRILVLVCSH
jgi:hypothetical protein